jgi:dihydrofolate reductase
LVEAIHATRNPTWLIGGAQIYAEGMQYAEGIDLTVVPDCVEHPEATRFPDIDLTRFVKDRVSHNDEDPRLACLFYRQCL